MSATPHRTKSGSQDDSEPRTPAELSDDELVDRARDDDQRAYGELWLRHSAAAHAVARAYTSLDPDDVVAEAFARILSAIQRGGGPSMGFRPYLLTSVRNVAHQWGARQSQTYATDLEDAADEAAPDAEWSAIAGFESSAVAAAFATLPTRWQEALWYSEVDGLKPRQFAPLLGLAPNAASALVIRARRGFRDAWVSAQLRRADDDECRLTLEMLGAHSRSGLSRRDARRVEQHLSTCEGCALAWIEARDISSRLALVLVPLVVGIPAAASYSAWTQSGAAQVATFALGPNGATGAAGPASASSATGTAPRPISAAARSAARKGWRHPLFLVGAIAVVGTAVAFSAPLLSTADLPSGTAEAQASPPNSGQVPGADADTDADADADTAETPSGPSAPEAPTAPPAPPHDSRSNPDTTPRSSDPSIPSAPFAPSQASPATPDTATPDTATPSPEPAPAPTPAPSPTTTPPPATAAPAAPTMSVDSSAGPSVYPLISGEAEPGALVEVVDDGGTVWARTAANERGTWTVSDLSGGIDQTDAAAYLPAGDRSLAARQQVDGATSPLCPPSAVTVTAPPAFTSPLAGSTVAASGFDLAATGQPNLQMQRARVGETVPWRDQPMALDADGRYTSRFSVPTAGPVTLGLRYLDPATGRFGPASFVSFTAY
ncbi:sigma-70 family RNA polymerase sigma factor [Microbacterium sp. SMR1]|uniref:sigma-70 family RNA polymerase sigma factor n=1 Tax=Microbacterium sp. SMR1 TaxID=1497340 RepID=UPI0015EC94D4|nr:sigma-70 family RNA polymerase sigma factor [Microbacterium sp. SMR1]